MILQWAEADNGDRHVHHPSCNDLRSPSYAGAEVWEIELPDDASEDDVIVTVWDDLFEGEEVTDEELDTYGEMTVFRECLDELFPPGEPAADVGDDESSGNPKADDFMDSAEEAGWTVDFAEDEGLVKVRARRASEVLDLTWSATRLEDAHYVSGLIGDVAKRLSSVAGARERLTAGPPSPRADRRQVKREEIVKRELKVILPFDVEEAYDDEIIKKVQGRKIIWWNNVSENYETAICIRQKNHIKIETGTAGRAILTFVSPEGFRSVALEQLVQVR